jgi:hypothetical protein
VGPLGVVGREPGVGDLTHLLERVEEVRVENLFAERAIEALDEGVLIRLAGLDVAIAIRCAPAPLDEGLGGELRPVVDALEDSLNRRHRHVGPMVAAGRGRCVCRSWRTWRISSTMCGEVAKGCLRGPHFCAFRPWKPTSRYRRSQK